MFSSVRWKGKRESNPTAQQEGKTSENYGLDEILQRLSK